MNPPVDTKNLIRNIIIGDICAIAIVIAGAFWPVINYPGAYVTCMEGAITNQASSLNMFGSNLEYSAYICTEAEMSDDITFIAMGISFAFYTILFSFISVVGTILNKPKDQEQYPGRPYNQ